MKILQLSLLAGNPNIEPKEVAVMAGAGVACLIAVAVRLTLTRYGVNKWVPHW